MIELTSQERRGLRARAHHLEPVVIIGGGGLTPAVLKEIETHLKSQELIKIKVRDAERGLREDMAQTISETLDAATVQHIGKTIVIYRPCPESSDQPQPRAQHRKIPRRTKRSYQMR